MAAPGGPGTVIVPWYATGFRADSFGAALNEIAPVALRYGASAYAVYRFRDDLYKFQQLAAFEDQLDWERYWEGPEMIEFKTITSGWYQVPVLYGWWDLTVGGALVPGTSPAGDGVGNGWGSGVGAGERS